MAVTPNPSRRSGVCLPSPSPAPFLTPRMDKRQLDPRWACASSLTNRLDKDKDVHVRVVLRCRPLSEEEQKLKVQKVISCNEQKNEVTVLQTGSNKQVDKTFSFDKVFGPKVQQRSIYDYAIAPFVKDVLKGFNCTVFAYGQTGTGKTYTMEWGTNYKGGDNLSGDAGVIPRAVRDIFNVLEGQRADYSMKASFLELYNEEIIDLLVSEDQSRFADDKQRRPICLMDDGKEGVIIRGLQEEVVYGANDVYNLLERGSAKRRTTDTLSNKRSSRSHSIFSITIHVKEVMMGHEELIKCGRLNLVDLAGSENISKSGAREGRAREAGEMNKSLLTLGRVITALVEHSGHIPYRDSKLTRLLRESLGGKTKTCIIATIAPSVYCVEESLSTLDYAYRAKSIRNKPEANQKIFKSLLLKDLYSEIERLKQDVRAAREKNGFYISHERLAQDEAEKKAMSDKLVLLELDLDLHKQAASRFQELYQTEQEKNLGLEVRSRSLNLENSKRALQDIQDAHKITKLLLKEKDFIISDLLQSEHAILQRAKEMHGSLENASENMSLLFAKIERQTKTEKGNRELISKFGTQLDQSLKYLHKTVIGSVCQHHQALRSIEEQLTSFLSAKCEATKNLELRIAKMKDVHSAGIQGMKELAHALQKKSLAHLDHMNSKISVQIMAVENFLDDTVSEAEKVLIDAQNSLEEQKELLAFASQQQQMGLQRSLVSTQLISTTTINFFNDLQERVSSLATVLEANQMEKSHQLDIFEMKFKELSIKEEKAAFEKIAEILRELTATKDNMVRCPPRFQVLNSSKVLEAVNSMNEKNLEAEKRLHAEMLGIQQVSDNAKCEWMTYVEKAERQFEEDTTVASETRTNMENLIGSCSMKVDKSVQYLERTQISLNQLNKDHGAQMDSCVEIINRENTNVLKEFMLSSTCVDRDFENETSHLLATAKDLLSLDHEAGNGIMSMTTMCVDQFEKLQEGHSETIKKIRSSADICLSKNYLVDHPTSTTPKKSKATVPCWSSIEELKSPCLSDSNEGRSERRSDNMLRIDPEGKHHHSLPLQTSRSPLTTIN